MILTAHHDAGRTGLLYGLRLPSLRRRRATLTSPLHFLFWTVMVALVAAIVRLAVDESGALTCVQFVLAAIFLTYVVLLLDSAAAAPSPGASDNASGVAAAAGGGTPPDRRAAGADRDLGLPDRRR